ncbi:hypothetical protein SLA2020_015820 [Shorea laevis]
MSEDRQIDPAIVHPSIALLKERFRQLKRAKEIRQEKELLRMLPESRQSNADQCSYALCALQIAFPPCTHASVRAASSVCNQKRSQSAEQEYPGSGHSDSNIGEFMVQRHCHMHN